jgi:predicted Holliday junction resolvase-like endonuclease
MNYQSAFYVLLVVFFLLVVIQSSILSLARDIIKFKDKHIETLDMIRLAYQKERADLLDRLMAQDLRELKLAQKMEDKIEKPKVVSKHMNDKRIMEEKAKISQ